ncbi:hypothetical protein Q7P37_009916 [Cladosporium fusiforme]
MTSAEKAECMAMGDGSPGIVLRRVDLQPKATKARLVGSIADAIAMLATSCRKTAAEIFESNRSSSSMVVGATASMDNSILAFSSCTRETMKLCHGDLVYVTSNKREKTMLVSIIDDGLEDGFVHMNWVARENLGVRLGDTVTVDRCLDAKYLKRGVILPMADTFGDITSSPFDLFLAPYFYATFRPLRQGDVFTCNVETGQPQFRVVEVDPPEGGIVAQNTTISCDPTGLDANGSTFRTLRQKCRGCRIALSALRVFYQSCGHTLQSFRKRFGGNQVGRARSCCSSTEALLAKS